MKKSRNYEVTIVSEVLSDSYRPGFTINGGGYPQPTIAGFITWKGCRKPIDFLIEDTSCGEFGDRYEITLSNGPKEMCGFFRRNNIDFGGCLDDESTFTRNRATLAIRDALKRKTDFRFLLEDEIEPKEGVA